MKNEDNPPNAAGKLSLKERLELERWAKLNGMSLEEYLASDMHPDLATYRKLRRGNEPESDGQTGG